MHRSHAATQGECCGGEGLCLLADEPAEMLAALRWCYAQGEGLVEMGHRAAEFCVENYDNLEVARRLTEELERVRGAVPRRRPDSGQARLS